MERRRARGNARWRGNGTWQLKAYAGRDDANAKRWQYRTVPGPPPTAAGGTPRSVEKELTKFVSELDRGIERKRGPGRPKRSEVTVGQAAAAWVKTAVLEPNGRDTAATIIRCHIRPGLGDVALWRLRPRLLAAPGDPDWDPDLFSLSGWYDDLAGKLQPTTIRRVHSTLRSVLAYAQARNWVAQNPAIGVELPAVKRRPATTPRPDVLRRFLRYVEQADPDLYAFCHLMSSGARRLNIGVRLGEFDHRTGELFLAQRAVVASREPCDRSGCAVEGDHTHEHVLIRETPTAKRKERRVALGQVSADALRAQRARILERALMCGVRLDDAAYLFSPEPDASKPYRADWATQQFARLRERAVKAGMAGMSGVRLYDLRHYMISEMLAQGVAPAVIAERAGNTERIMDDYYRHRVPVADRAAADLLDQGLL